MMQAVENSVYIMIQIPSQSNAVWSSAEACPPSILPRLPQNLVYPDMQLEAAVTEYSVMALDLQARLQLLYAMAKQVTLL